MKPPRRFVLDSSVALGAFFEDEQDDYSLAVWRSMDDAQAHVPDLWHLEMGNILGRALRQGRIDAPALQVSWERLGDVGLQTSPVACDGLHWARRTTDWGLTAYDAVYLELALTLRAPLATKDTDLRHAARRAGVPIYLDPVTDSPR